MVAVEAEGVMKNWEIAAACTGWVSSALIGVALAGVFVAPVLAWWLIDRALKRPVEAPPHVSTRA